MFCICCLEGNGPYIKLVKCVHGDYLEMFTIPDLKPPIEQVICYQCHAILRKIKQFKIQVEESFSLLLNKSYSMEMKNSKMKNIRVSKVVHLNIPDTAETIDAKAENITNNRNIETALEIINNNSTSLQTLAACNLTSITETLLKATTENLNLELNRKVLPKTSELKKEVVDTNAVLPVNIKYEIENEDIDIIDNTIVLPGHNENDLETEQATENNRGVDGNPAVLPIKTEEGDSNMNVYVDELLNGAVTAAYDKIKDYNRTVLPADIRKQPDDVDNECVYGTAVFPAVKSEPEDGSNSFTKRVMELNDSSSESSSKNDDDNVAPGERPGAPPLIPIRLRKEELAEERSAKLTSVQYLQWPYRCDLCIIGFNYKVNLSDHIKRKHEIKKICVSCEVCQQVILKDEMNDHEFRHYNRLECEKCKKRFVLFDEAYEHYKQLHDTGKTKRNIKQDLKTYWRNKKRKHGEDNEYKADSGIPATVTSSMTAPGDTLDYANALTRDVTTKINKLY